MNAQSCTKATINISLIILLYLSIFPIAYSNPDVETRYMRSDLDGTFYKLLTDNTTPLASLAVSTSGAVAGYIAIRIRDQDGNIIVDWTEIRVTDTTYTLYSISVDVPETYVEKIIVDVRVKAVPTTNTRSFRTDTLDATVSGTWNFKLWAIYKYIPSPANVTTVTFTHGSSIYDSRIENFSWSIIEEKEWYDITTWNFNVQTRQWNSISMFTFNLLTRQWSDISTFNLNLLTRTWQDITTSSFSLLSRFWQIIASWNLNFQILKWNDITTWIFNLPVIGWQTISQWIFSLPALGWHNLVYWLSQLEAVTVSRYPLYYFYLLIIGLVTFIIYMSKKKE